MLKSPVFRLFMNFLIPGTWILIWMVILTSYHHLKWTCQSLISHARQKRLQKQKKELKRALPVEIVKAKKTSLASLLISMSNWTKSLLFFFCWRTGLNPFHFICIATVYWIIYQVCDPDQYFILNFNSEDFTNDAQIGSKLVGNSMSLTKELTEAEHFSLRSEKNVNSPRNVRWGIFA